MRQAMTEFHEIQPSRRGPALFSRLLWCVLAASVLLGGSDARACNTPVFRYAMYNWAPAPYFVFYFHGGEPAQEDEPVNKLIEELSETGPVYANVVFESVDVSGDGAKYIPKPVMEAWQAHVGEDAESPKPVHLVFTSWGAKLFVGRLDAATVRAMVDSPIRTRIGELFNDGCATAIVMVPGVDVERPPKQPEENQTEAAEDQEGEATDEEAAEEEDKDFTAEEVAAENKRVEEVARDLIEKLASGEIPIASTFDDTFYQTAPEAEDPVAEGKEDGADEDPEEPENAFQVELLKIDRSNVAEKWLLDSLLAMEPDLGELAEQPMLFFFYGRGRAMPPFVGRGVSPDHLLAEIEFLSGACSCMVKEQNPGFDMLFHWDWEATADAMAATDESLYADQYGYQEFMAGPEPEEETPTEETATDGSATDQTTIDEPTVDEPASDEAMVDEPVIDEATSDQTSINEPAVDEAAIDEPVTDISATDSAKAVDAQSTSQAQEDVADLPPDETATAPAPDYSASPGTTTPTEAYQPDVNQPGGGASYSGRRRMWGFGAVLAVLAVSALAAGFLLRIRR